MSSHLSRNDLHRRYRRLGVQIVPNIGPPSAKWRIELPDRTLGLARNLIEAESFIKSFIRKQEEANAQRQGTDHSNAPSTEQPGDPSGIEPHDPSNGSGSAG